MQSTLSKSKKQMISHILNANTNSPRTVLGFPPTASPSRQEVKKQFQMVAKLIHPDKTQNDPEASQATKRIIEAKNRLLGSPSSPQQDTVYVPTNSFPTPVADSVVECSCIHCGCKFFANDDFVILCFHCEKLMAILKCNNIAKPCKNVATPYKIHNLNSTSRVVCQGCQVGYGFNYWPKGTPRNMHPSIHSLPPIQENPPRPEPPPSPSVHITPSPSSATGFSTPSPDNSTPYHSTIPPSHNAPQNTSLSIRAVLPPDTTHTSNDSPATSDEEVSPRLVFRSKLHTPNQPRASQTFGTSSNRRELLKRQQHQPRAQLHFPKTSLTAKFASLTFSTPTDASSLKLINSVPKSPIRSTESTTSAGTAGSPSNPLSDFASTSRFIFPVVHTSDTSAVHPKDDRSAAKAPTTTKITKTSMSPNKKPTTSVTATSRRASPAPAVSNKKTLKHLPVSTYNLRGSKKPVVPQSKEEDQPVDEPNQFPAKQSQVVAKISKDGQESALYEMCPRDDQLTLGYKLEFVPGRMDALYRPSPQPIDVAQELTGPTERWKHAETAETTGTTEPTKVVPQPTEVIPQLIEDKTTNGEQGLKVKRVTRRRGAGKAKLFTRRKAHNTKLKAKTNAKAEDESWTSAAEPDVPDMDGCIVKVNATLIRKGEDHTLRNFNWRLPGEQMIEYVWVLAEAEHEAIQKALIERMSESNEKNENH